MNEYEHETQSNFTLRHKSELRNSTIIYIAGSSILSISYPKMNVKILQCYIACSCYTTFPAGTAYPSGARVHPRFLVGFVLLDLQFYMYVLQIVVCPVVLFLFAIVLHVLLRYKNSDCPFGILKLFCNFGLFVFVKTIYVYIVYFRQTSPCY